MQTFFITPIKQADSRKACAENTNYIKVNPGVLGYLILNCFLLYNYIIVECFMELES